MVCNTKDQGVSTWLSSGLGDHRGRIARVQIHAIKHLGTSVCSKVFLSRETSPYIILQVLINLSPLG